MNLYEFLAEFTQNLDVVENESKTLKAIDRAIDDLTTSLMDLLDAREFEIKRIKVDDSINKES